MSLIDKFFKFLKVMLWGIRSCVDVARKWNHFDLPISAVFLECQHWDWWVFRGTFSHLLVAFWKQLQVNYRSAKAAERKSTISLDSNPFQSRILNIPKHKQSIFYRLWYWEWGTQSVGFEKCKPFKISIFKLFRWNLRFFSTNHQRQNVTQNEVDHLF